MPHPYLDAPTPLAFAHRGGAAAGDENTMEAFGRAIALGYRYVETDVHATADGVPVLCHDPTLARLAGRPDAIADLTWSDLATVRVGGAAAMPRLDDVLGTWPGIRFNLDIKADPAVEPSVAALRRAGAADRVLLASFSDARLVRLRRLAGPDVATSLGRRGVARLRLAAATALRPRLPASVVAVQVPVRAYRLRLGDSARFIRLAHRLGLQVHVWTVDEPTQIHGLLDAGVDGIMTDQVEVLRDVYRSRGCWHPGEGT